MPKFSVTYEILTAADAESEDCCEASESGFIVQDVDLRDAIGHVNETESPHCSQSGIEANDSRIDMATWFTVYNSADYISGDTETRALHIPDSVTASSRRRIARLLGITA